MAISKTENFKIKYTHAVSGQTLTECSVSIIGVEGVPLLLSNGDKAQKLPMTLVSGMWETADLTLLDTTPDQPVRLYFYTKTSSGNVTPNNADNPRYDEVKNLVDEVFSVQYVTPDYFLKQFLAVSSKADEEYKEAVTAFIADNPNGLQNFLDSAVAEIESKLKTFIGKRKITGERRDFNKEEIFHDNFWLNFTDYGPIISLEKMEIMFGKDKITEVDASFFLVSPKGKQIELVPTNGFQVYYNAHIAPNLFAGGLYGNSSRIPGFFKYEYYAGLNFAEMLPHEKTEIRNLICLKALLEAHPHVDSIARKRSSSLSVDGASNSSSYDSTAFLKLLSDSYESKVSAISSRYQLDFAMVIV